MTKRTVAKTVGIIVLLAVASLIWTGCSSGPARTNPALPPGFAEAQVPAGEISAYLYVSQGTPVTIPTERFGDVSTSSRKSGSVIIHDRDSLEVMRLALWTGQSLDSFAGDFKFRDEATAEVVQKLAAEKADVAAIRSGILLSVAQGTTDWAKAMEGFLRANQRSPFKDAYPAAWDLLHLMPEAPPGKPVAVGFVHVNDALMNSLASKAGLNLSGIGQAFGAANVSDIAFIAYADTPLALPNVVGPDYFKQAGLGAIFVAQSTYPGFVLSFFLGSFADRAGLEKGPTIQGQQVLVKEIEGAQLMVATVGNTFFVALAPTQEKAEALMTSALAPRVKG
ncbi:MAG: hypothetical protein Q7K03_06875 [Dehalococcoidia bacterium]|nr:hypothetical protein [Dehalococcoidia bacterium]